MAETEHKPTFEQVLEQLRLQADVIWGDGYAESHQDLLQQAAGHIVAIANQPLIKETEPGFFQ